MKRYELIGYIQQCWTKFLTVLSLCLIAACTPESEKSPIRLASNYWIGYEPFFVAESMQLFEKGSVHLIEAPFSFILEQSLRGGTIDAASVSLSKAFSLFEGGFDITIVLVLDWSDGADKLLAHPEIKTVADLRGRRVASEPHTVNRYLLVRALQENGLSPDDITIVPHINEKTVAAYKNGDVVAGTVFGAEVPRFKKAGAHTIFDSSMIPGEILDVLIVRTSYLRKNPERVAHMISGWLKGVEAVKNFSAGDPRPFGLVSEADYSATVNEIRFASGAENLAFMEVGAAQLKAVLKTRLSIRKTTGKLPLPGQVPPIDTGPFFTVYKSGEK